MIWRWCRHSGSLDRAAGRYYARLYTNRKLRELLVWRWYCNQVDEEKTPVRSYVRWILPALMVVGGWAFAQNSCDFGRAPGKEPASAVAEKSDSTGVSVKTRISEKRSEFGNRTIVIRTLESVSVYGNYAPIAVCEEETVRVDANTTGRSIRSYGFNFDGRKVLIETVEEQSKKLANGAEEIVRTKTQQNEKGQQRVVRRELENSRPVAAHTTETDTTVLLPDMNTGGLTPNAMTKEVRRQA